MSRRTWLASSALLFIIAGAIRGGSVWLHERSEGEHTRERARADQMNRLEARLAHAERVAEQALRTEHESHTPVAPIAHPSQNATASSAIAPTATTTALGESEIAARTRQQTLRRGAYVQEALLREARDSSWARAAEDSITQIMHGPAASRFPGVRLLDSDCRTTLCSIHVGGASAIEVGEAARALARLGRSFGYVDTQPSGEAKLNAFLVRDGHSLPSPDDSRDDSSTQAAENW
jgi:hypothetical protein